VKLILNRKYQDIDSRPAVYKSMNLSYASSELVELHVHKEVVDLAPYMPWMIANMDYKHKHGHGHIHETNS
jgi:hypothetical protein